MEQKDFLELANTWVNIDLWGYAWTGKTFILKQFIEEQRLLWKNIIVVRPTWIAAINIWWVTIHSTFKIFWNQYWFINKQKVSWREIDIIIFDEKSMIWPDLFDFTDSIVRRYSKNKDKPFWWKQIILCWDMAQLQPIYKNVTKEEIETNLKLKEKYWTLIYSSAGVYKTWNFKEIFLTEIFRQTDMRLLDVLNKLREWDLSVLKLLQQWWYNEKQEKESVHLMPYNNMVDQYNYKQFSSIREKEHHFKWRISWKINIDNILTPEDLYLKKRCRVMLTKNIFEEWLYNWDLGIITKISDRHIEVNFDRVWIKHISKMTRENREYEWKESKIIWTFTQIPLRLAYRLTIHKSQWLSIDKIILHYIPWMTKEAVYTAISRATNYDTLFLAK